MACFLLTWNPARWTWETLEQDLQRVALGDVVEHRWSTGNTRRIVAGDRIFLLKQGTPPRGLMGSGVATSAVEEMDHWDDERKAAGHKALYVHVRFDRLVEPDAVLPVDELNTGALAEMYWTPPASGFEVPEHLVDALEKAWASHLPHRPSHAMAEELTPGAAYVEGTAHTVLVNRYERSPEARRACIEAHGDCCVVCGFSFGDVYGALGEGYIHVHHLEPLHRAQGERAVDPVRDLRPVCPNCHAMLHRREPPLSIEDLRDLLRTDNGSDPAG